MRRFVDSLMFLLVAYTVGLPFVRSVLGSEPEALQSSTTIAMPVDGEDDVLAHEISEISVTTPDGGVSDLRVGIPADDSSVSQAGDSVDGNSVDGRVLENDNEVISVPMIRLIPAQQIR